MSDEQDHSFRDMTLKDKIVTVIGATLFMSLVLGFVLAMFFFGFAGAFELLGVQYQSIWSLLLFVASFFILGTVVDLPFEAMAELSVKNMTGRGFAFFVQLLFSFASNWLVIVAVDAFIDSITLSGGTKLILSLLLAVLDPVFDNKQKGHDQAV
ncbi:hypothetical protein GCM10028778_12150 [Barrientosiimonas marina]|uniref:YrvL family regulatory protein n=1 Tax=Lentibacillus kimchii TaxID=1542911 RepID=A0ABW2UX26_9BACI